METIRERGSEEFARKLRTTLRDGNEGNREGGAFKKEINCVSGQGETRPRMASAVVAQLGGLQGRTIRRVRTCFHLMVMHFSLSSCSHKALVSSKVTITFAGRGEGGGVVGGEKVDPRAAIRYLGCRKEWNAGAFVAES